MRVAVVLLVAAALSAGCTATPDFATLAMKAPDLLKADEVATGTLVKEAGNLSMDMTLQMQEHSMRMQMVLEIEKEHLEGGAFLANLTMHDLRLDGKLSDVTLRLRLFCSPTRIAVRGGPGMGGLDHNLTNGGGACPPDGSFLNSTGGQLDAQTLAVLRTIMEQSKVPDLKFDRVETGNGTNVAIYRSTMEYGMTGIDMHLTMDDRATLTGPRIARMDRTGMGDLSNTVQQQTMTAHIEIKSTTTYTYGRRGPVPAEFA